MTQATPPIIHCTACGFQPPAWASFCPQCGHELPLPPLAPNTEFPESSTEHTLDNLPASSETVALAPAQSTVQISPLTQQKFQELVREIQDRESVPLVPPTPLPAQRQTMMLEPDVLTRIKSQGLGKGLAPSSSSTMTPPSDTPKEQTIAPPSKTPPVLSIHHTLQPLATDEWSAPSSTNQTLLMGTDSSSPVWPGMDSLAKNTLSDFPARSANATSEMAASSKQSSPGATATFSSDLSPYLLQDAQVDQGQNTNSPHTLPLASSAKVSAQTSVYQRDIVAPITSFSQEPEPQAPVTSRSSSAAQRTMVMDDDNIQAWIQDMGVSLSPKEEQRIDDAAETLAQAEHAVDQQEYAKAIDLYLALIRSFPEQTQYQERLSQLWLQLRDEKSLPAPSHAWFRSSALSWFSAVTMVALVLFVVVGFLWKNPSSSPVPSPRTQKQQAPPARPKLATLQIQSIPAGASLWLNDQAIPTATPTTFARPAGEYQLVLKKKGFRPMQMRIQLNEGQLFAAAFALAPASVSVPPSRISRRRSPTPPRPVSPASRTIRFTTNPPGASILLNDRDISRKTPTSLSLRYGEYFVHFRLTGYPNFIRAVRVDAQTESTIHTTLGQQEPKKRTLSVDTEPSGASIWINQTDTGKKTPSRLEVPTTPFVLTLKLTRYHSIQQTITPGETAPLRFVLKLTGPTGMKWIAPGFFWMGNNAGMEREKPMRKVYLRGFWMDQYEVTAQQYQECVQQKVCRAVPQKPGCHGNQPSHQQHPVNCVSWYDAKTYCRWKKKRLPTEAEWEKAARGPSPQLYPWGHSSPSCNQAHYEACGVSGTRPVGSLPAGRSSYGLYDMAGNVWEWVQDRYDRGFYRKGVNKNPVNLSGTGNYRVIRGGAWNSPEDRIHTTYRADFWAMRRTHTVGFRCAQ